LEEHGEAQAIAGSFIADIESPLDPTKRVDSPAYLIKSYVLDFIYSCLQANPDRPTIAHLLLGFQCETNALGVEADSSFDQREALFHSLLRLVVEVPLVGGEEDMQLWLVNLKYKAMRVLKVLWSSTLSSAIVLDELRDHEFLFHLLLQGFVTRIDGLWDGQEVRGPDFLMTPAAQAYIDYLSMRAMVIEYVTHELCSVSHGHMPALKRRIFDALGGQIPTDNGESITIPSIFQFQDTLPQDEELTIPPPEFPTFHDLDLRACLEEDDDTNRIYNLPKVEEVLVLKCNESRNSGQVILRQEPDPVESERQDVLGYVAYLNRLTQFKSYSLKVLKSWTKLLLVMTDCNDFKGANQVSFILQTLQAILPSLESYTADKPEAAYELARLAKVLLFKLDFATMSSTDKQGRAMESSISEKLSQLLQLCLGAIARWTGNPKLRVVYYSICYRYLSGLVDHSNGNLVGRRKTAKTIQAFGDRLVNVICDDAFGGDAGCQASALILLSTLVNLGNQENDNYIVESLNRLNFIGILVDSLRAVMQEWADTGRIGKLQLISQGWKIADHIFR
jgi:nuclear pore complex protein Nup205